MGAAEVGRLLGLGLGMGVVHVLSGPDHLSALATLAVDGKLRAFWLGVRWGLGHSLGLLVIAVTFIAADGAFDLEAFSAVCAGAVDARRFSSSDAGAGDSG